MRHGRFCAASKKRFAPPYASNTDSELRHTHILSVTRHASEMQKQTALCRHDFKTGKKDWHEIRNTTLSTACSTSDSPPSVKLRTCTYLPQKLDSCVRSLRTMDGEWTTLPLQPTYVRWATRPPSRGCPNGHVNRVLR